MYRALIEELSSVASPYDTVSIHNGTNIKVASGDILQVYII